MFAEKTFLKNNYQSCIAAIILSVTHPSTNYTYMIAEIGEGFIACEQTTGW